MPRCCNARHLSRWKPNTGPMTVIVFWTLIFAVTGLCAAMLVAAVWIRSIVRPNWLRARQTYGSPQEHGFPAEDVTLPGGIYGWWAHNPNAEFDVLLVER